MWVREWQEQWGKNKLKNTRVGSGTKSLLRACGV